MGENLKHSRQWETDPESMIGWKPKFKFYCPQCRPPALFFWMKKHIMRQDMGYVFAFKLGEIAKEARQSCKRYDQRNSFAMDIWSRCPHCGFNTVNGMPIFKEEYTPVFERIAAAARAGGWGEDEEELV